MSIPVLLGDKEVQVTQIAAQWRLLSLLFECPNEEWRADVSALMNEVSDELLRSAAQDALQEAKEGVFHHTFGPGGPAPAREATYHQTLQLGYLMSEIESFYNAFAFHTKTAEAPDHIAVETAFMSYLHLKEAYALASGDVARASVTADAARQFLNEHLRRFAHPLAGHLENSGIEYLTKAGEALRERVKPPEKASDVLPILQTSEDSEDFECGSDCKDPVVK